MNTVTIDAFNDELYQIKLAQLTQIMPAARKAVTGIMQRVGAKPGVRNLMQRAGVSAQHAVGYNPGAKREGLARVGQLLSGSRQKVLQSDYLRTSADLIRRGGGKGAAGGMHTVDPSIIGKARWGNIGSMAKEELAERGAMKGARRIAGGALAATTVGLAGGAMGGASR